ncbi:MAG: hypothetical protein WC299_10505, partial [Kiritimatiellia bacterium]
MSKETFAVAAVLAIIFSCQFDVRGASAALKPKGQVNWPSEWTAFAPLERYDRVPEGAELKAVPSTMSFPAAHDLPARAISGRKFKVNPGEAADLAQFFETARVGNAAIVYVELNSPKAQTVTLGMGADWWLQAWLNGAPLFDTLKDGNVKSPISILNHTIDVELQEGKNVLAVRFISGAASAKLALGGPGEFAAEEKRLAAHGDIHRLNVLPATLAGRMVFPMEEQAYAAAEKNIVFPDAGVDLSKGGLAGVQPMPARQMYYNRPTGELLDTEERRFADPVKLLLSKFRYPWEDRHLDAIVWLSPPPGQVPEGELELALTDGDRKVLARHVITNLCPHGVFLSLGFPAGLQGKKGLLEASWRSGGQVLASTQAVFHVDVPAIVAQAGRIPLHILNGPGAVISNAPMTVGVPFPRGALDNESRVRLLDENGAEMPLQTRVTGRWSRFGPVKWLLCDFTADLAGRPRGLFLEYGQNVERKAQTPLAVTVPEKGFPALDAGRIKISPEGLGFDPDGGGNFRPVLAPDALYGGFVEHENGKRFIVPGGARHAVEELGSEKAVIRRTGWFVDEKSGEKFCNFVTRFVFHRKSPVVRMFHTWIFTGNGNKDRIRDMGWRFGAGGKIKPEGFLASFTNRAWLAGQYLVQFDYQAYDLDGKG